jgi:hypothetical protein
MGNERTTTRKSEDRELAEDEMKFREDIFFWFLE